MCASGATPPIDEELSAILHGHQNQSDASLGLEMKTAPSPLQGLPRGSSQSYPEQSSELQSTVGLYRAMFGSPSSEQSVLPTTSNGLIDSANVQFHQMFSTSSTVLDAVSSRFQAGQSSHRSATNGMDIDEHPPLDNHSGSAVLAAGRTICATETGEVTGTLMRYHSAPSSILASLAGVSEELLPPVSTHLNDAAGAQFARYMGDVLSPATPRNDRSQTRHTLNGLEADQRFAERIDCTRFTPLQPRLKRAVEKGAVDDVPLASLSAILEHSPNPSSENFGSPQTIACMQQVASRTGQAVGVSGLVGDNRLCSPFVSPAPNFSTLSQSKSNLIRHSSSPGEQLSRLAVEAQCQIERIERLGRCFSGPVMHTVAESLPNGASKKQQISSAAGGLGLVPSFSSRNFLAGKTHVENADGIRGFGVTAAPSTVELLRQTSLPGGLLSQLSVEGINESGEKSVTTSSSGNSSEDGNFERSGQPFLPSFPFVGWDDRVIAPGNSLVGMQNGVAFPVRKRVREFEAKLFTGSTLSDCQQGEGLDQFSMLTAGSPDNQIATEHMLSELAPCRARAKRGCATHPRSIAERVRRTKISERMRRLQELVPNMDKQTNTADMLDE
eukprot:c21583_g1_i1 orf=1-1836(-)